MKREETTVFTVVHTKPFADIFKEALQEHPGLASDFEWIKGRLEIGPCEMGDHVPALKKLNLPVFKTRLKDSCCKLSSSEGWRLYYAVSKSTSKVYMLFMHHKKELENPARQFLQQKIQRAFSEGV